MQQSLMVAIDAHACAFLTHAAQAFFSIGPQQINICEWLQLAKAEVSDGLTAMGVGLSRLNWRTAQGTLKEVSIWGRIAPRRKWHRQEKRTYT